MANPVFISYRRSDTTGEAGRLADSLENLLGAACVFRDADDIPAGEDFAVFLKRELADTRVVVVLIGKKWLAELNSRPYAWVRLALRAVAFIAAAVIATKYAVGALAPDSDRQLELARAIIVGLLVLYAGLEGYLWRKHKKRMA